MRPVIISNFLHSATILADACGKLLEYCVEGAELNRDQIDAFVGRSLMLVTALSPVIGYDKASAAAHKANDEGTTLRGRARDRLHRRRRFRSHRQPRRHGGHTVKRR
jgi:fumarate hydratase, class II